MKEAKDNNPDLQSAINLGKRCGKRCEQVIDNERSGEIDVEPFQLKYRKPGGGRKKTIPDVRQALFDWSVDTLGTLKDWLPRKMFKTKCKLFYDEWLTQQDEMITGEKKLSS